MADKQQKPVTLVEVAPFSKHVASVMTAQELEEFKYFIASNPDEGSVIRGTNGVRKVRWAVEGKGKSGGARLIYYYHHDDMPLFLITAYKKSARVSLTQKQRNAMAKLVQTLVEHYQ
jgi:hypothetical protein